MSSFGIHFTTNPTSPNLNHRGKQESVGQEYVGLISHKRGHKPDSTSFAGGC